MHEKPFVPKLGGWELTVLIIPNFHLTVKTFFTLNLLFKLFINYFKKSWFDIVFINVFVVAFSSK